MHSSDRAHRLTGWLLVVFCSCWARVSPLWRRMGRGVGDLPIRIGGDYNYPPYEYLDADGLPTGYNVELTQAIARVMGLEINIQLSSWGEMRQALDLGQVDF